VVLSGLKPQVQSAPFSLEMVSVLLDDVLALLGGAGTGTRACTGATADREHAGRDDDPVSGEASHAVRPYCRLVLTGRGAGGCALTRRLRVEPVPAHHASAGASSQCLRAEQPPRYVTSIRTPVRVAKSCDFSGVVDSPGCREFLVVSQM